MPITALKNMAKKSGKSVKTLERYWREAKKEVGENYAEVMGIVKKRAGLASVLAMSESDEVGLIEWVAEYIMIRHRNNLNLAKEMKKSIDNRMKEIHLSDKEKKDLWFYFGDPDNPKEKEKVFEKAEKYLGRTKPPKMPAVANIGFNFEEFVKYLNATPEFEFKLKRPINEVSPKIVFDINKKKQNPDINKSIKAAIKIVRRHFQGFEPEVFGNSLLIYPITEMLEWIAKLDFKTLEAVFLDKPITSGDIRIGSIAKLLGKNNDSHS